MNNKIPTVICDIDGTISDCEHRLHLINNRESADWNTFYEDCIKDQPIKPVVDMLLSLKNNTQIIFVTGRTEQVRHITYDWLKKHLGQSFGSCPMYMRNNGDLRTDVELKEEIYNKYLKRLNILFVIEDKQECVDMWRSKKLNCIQVNKGVIL